MNKHEYLNKLAIALNALPDDERNEIIADYTEHFDVAKTKGKSESEIIANLGDLNKIANEYRLTEMIEKVESNEENFPNQIFIAARAILIFILLAPFNFFLLVGPFLLLTATMILLWMTPIILFGGTIAGLLATTFGTTVNPVGIWIHLSYYFGSLGAIILSVLSVILLIELSKLVIKLVLGYIKLNIQLLKTK